MPEHGRWLARPERTGGRGGAAIPARHARAGDDVRRRRRRGSPDRLHAARGASIPSSPASSRGFADRWRSPRSSCSASTTARRFRGCGGSTTRRSRSPARTRCCIDTPVELRGVDLKTVGTVTVSEGDRVPFVLTWYPSHVPAPEPVDAEEALERTEAYWLEWSRRLRLRRRLGGAGSQLDPHAQGPHLRADRRDRRGADHLAAGVDRRRAELGLPVLLAAGRDADARRAHRRGLSRGGPGVAQLALPGRRRRSGRPPDHVRRRRRAPPARVRARLAAGLRGLPAGAGRKRRLRAAPARRLRRGDRRLLHRPRARAARHPTTPGSSRDTCSASWSRPGDEPDAGIWEMRGPNRALHPLEGDGVGGVRPRGAHGRGRRDRPGPVDRWRAVRDEIHADVCANGLRPELGAFTQSYGSQRLDASATAHPARRLPAAGRPRG